MGWCRVLGSALCLALGSLWACSTSHRDADEEPQVEATPDAGRTGCGSSAACPSGTVCVAGSCEAEDAGVLDAPARDAGPSDPLVEQVIVWQKPLDRLPTTPGSESVDLVVGDDGDLWLLGQTSADFTGRLWLERLAPDGTERWAEPWQSELPVVFFGIARPERIPAGFLVVDASGRATVGTTGEMGMGPTSLWLSQVGADGATRWTHEVDGYYLSDLAIDDGGRVYAALGALSPPIGAQLQSHVALARWLPDATQDTLVPIESDLTPPFELVVGDVGGESDTALYLAGARPQGFGGYEAFVGRFDLGLGVDTWPPAPTPTGPEDYSSVVSAASDGEGGIVAAVATAYPMYGVISDLDSTEGLREVRRYDADGTLQWSTPMRDDTGADRVAGFAEWGMEVVAGPDGTVYAAYTVGGEGEPGPFFGNVDVVLEKLLPDGGFAWRAPFVVHDDGVMRPSGLAVGPGGELYMLSAPRLSAGTWSNWVTRLDPSALEP